MHKETKNESIDWHSGFDGLLGIGFWKYRDKIQIDREHILSKRSLKIDFVLIKKTTDVHIDNAVGRNFRKYNIIEYKNSNDALNIDVLWKVKAFMRETAQNSEQGYRLNVKAVLRVGAMVNKEVFKIIGGEKTMGDVLKELLKDDFIAAEEKGIKIYIEDKLYYNIPKKETIKRLQEVYGLSLKKATEYYDRFAKEPAATK